MSLLDHDKSNWRLVIGLQGCTGLFPWYREDSQEKMMNNINPMLCNYMYLSDGIKFIQQYLIELSLTDTIPEIQNCLVY